MYAREHRVLLRHYLEQGLSKAEIARSLGVSRRTLYYWIDSGQLDRGSDESRVRYKPRPAVPCKIDRYREIIQTRLREYPRLSATRLFDEIRASGAL
jgi:transposase